MLLIILGLVLPILTTPAFLAGATSSASNALALKPLWASLGSVLCVDFSPDGRLLLTGDENGLVQVWNASNLLPVLIMPGRDLISDARFSPDGQRIVSGSTAVNVWNASSGELLVSIENAHGKGGVLSAAFSPDGAWIVSGGGDSMIRLWDSYTGQALQNISGHTDAVASVAFSPEGKRIVSGSRDNTARVWNITSSMSLVTLHTTLSAHSVRFSPDGTRVLVGSVEGGLGDSDSSISLWDAASGANVFEQQDFGYVADFSRDGRKIVAGNSASVLVLDAGSGSVLQTLIGPPSTIFGVCFSPDGSLVAVAGGEGQSATNNLNSLQVWNLAKDTQVVERLESPGFIESLSFSSDGLLLAEAISDFDPGFATPFRVMYAENGTRSVVFANVPQSKAFSLSFSPTNASMLTVGFRYADEVLGTWDPQTGKRLYLLALSDSVACVSYSPDGTLVAVSFWDGDSTIYLMDAFSGATVRTVAADEGIPTNIVFSPDGRYLAYAFDSPEVLVWSVATGERAMTLQVDGGPFAMINDVAYSPDGKWIAGCGDSIWIWDASTGALVRNITSSSMGFVHSLAFSPDSSLLATASADLRLWSVEDGEQLFMEDSFLNIPATVAFSPDGRLATAGNTELRVWTLTKT